MEVHVPECRNVLDFEAADLELFQTIARREGALGSSLRSGLAMHPLSSQIAPYRGVRGHRRAARLASHPQVIQVQLRRPARMFAVLVHQRRDGHRRQTGEEPLVGAKPVLQSGHRIGGTPRLVVPALQGRGAEAHVKARDRMTPGPGRQRCERADQLSRLGGCGEQGADDREAQARPSITFGGIGNCRQCRAPGEATPAVRLAEVKAT